MKKRFKFRLERIRKYRELLKKEKERELALKNAQLLHAHGELELILQAQDQAPGGGLGQTTMAELVLIGDYRRFLQDVLVKQRLLVLEAAEAAEQAKKAYVEKAIDAKTLEKLKLKKIEEYQEAERRDARKSLDRLTVMRHRLKPDGPIAGA